MPASRSLRVFLCHSSSDKPIVRELYQKLSSEGWIDVWLDEEKLIPGQEWEYEIEKALDNSDAVIVTLSKGSVSKEGYVQKELRFVLDISLEKPEGTIFILPVRLDDCERPRRLRSIQGIDYFPARQREKVYAQLLHGLELRANHLGISTKKAKSKPETPKKAKSRGKTRAPRNEMPFTIRSGDLPYAGSNLGGQLEFLEVLGDRSVPYDFFITQRSISREEYESYVNYEKAKENKARKLRFFEQASQTPSDFSDVTLEDAKKYCLWFTESLQLKGKISVNEIVRLPTEAEWEKAVIRLKHGFFPLPGASEEGEPLLIKSEGEPKSSGVSIRRRPLIYLVLVSAG